MNGYAGEQGRGVASIGQQASATRPSAGPSALADVIQRIQSRIEQITLCTNNLASDLSPVLAPVPPSNAQTGAVSGGPTQLLGALNTIEEQLADRFNDLTGIRDRIVL